MIICKICGREYIYSRKAGHTKTVCNSCVVNQQRKRRKKHIVQHLGRKCKRCGYNEFFSGLCCHHVDPTTKKFTISGKYAMNIGRFTKELDKCIMLCHNCHIALHRGDWELSSLAQDCHSLE